MFSAEDNDKTCSYYMAMPPTPHPQDHKVLIPAERHQVLFKWTLGSQSPELSAAAWTGFYCLPGDWLIGLFEPVVFSHVFMRLCVCVCVLGCFSRVRLFAILWTAALQAPLSMGFPRQEYWSGVSGDLSHPGIESRSPSLSVSHFFISLRFLIAFPVPCQYMSCSVRRALWSY